jgi:hypothetical protein
MEVDAAGFEIVGLGAEGDDEELFWGAFGPVPPAPPPAAASPPSRRPVASAWANLVIEPHDDQGVVQWKKRPQAVRPRVAGPPARSSDSDELEPREFYRLMETIEATPRHVISLRTTDDRAAV